MSPKYTRFKIHKVSFTVRFRGHFILNIYSCSCLGHGWTGGIRLHFELFKIFQSNYAVLYDLLLFTKTAVLKLNSKRPFYNKVAASARTYGREKFLCQKEHQYNIIPMVRQLPLKVGCLPWCAVGKQPSMPMISRGGKWTLRLWCIICI